MRKSPFKLLFLAAFLLGADQLSKLCVRLWLEPAGQIQVLPFFRLEHVRNRGIAFGMLEGKVAIIIFVGVLVVLMLFLAAFMVRRDGHWTWPFALLMAGSIGNLIDRLHQGSVTDFLKFSYWPAFNLADVFIVAGVMLMMWFLLFRPGRTSG